MSQRHLRSGQERTFTHYSAAGEKRLRDFTLYQFEMASSSSDSDVGMEEFDEFDGRGYLFEPEYTDQLLYTIRSDQIS